MNEKTIFYSWQDNLGHETNRKFIEEILNAVIEDFEKELKYKLTLDQATREKPGIPDIVDTILSKIDKTNFFIADITTVCKDSKERNFPNSNVLIELGYAIKSIGTENIICLFNSAFGELDKLPFDIKQRRITTYHLPKKHTPEKNKKEAKKLRETLEYAFQLILKNQSIYDEINEIIKPKIDHILLDMFNHLNEIVPLNKGTIFPDHLFNILEYSDKKISEMVQKSKPNELYLEKKWDTYTKELDEIVKHPLLIVIGDFKKIITIMELQDAIRITGNNFGANRFFEKENKMDKWKIKEPSILVLLIKELIKATDELLKTWGNRMIINPAFLK
ncbi:MAG: hypothetical protein R2830_05220 [Saprospiraceae bacterium]